MNARAAMSSAPKTQVGNGNTKENISQTNIATRTPINRNRCLFYSIYKIGNIISEMWLFLSTDTLQTGFHFNLTS